MLKLTKYLKADDFSFRVLSRRLVIVWRLLFKFNFSHRLFGEGNIFNGSFNGEFVVIGQSSAKLNSNKFVLKEGYKKFFLTKRGNEARL